MSKNTDATPKRLIRLKLSVDLIEAFEEIGASSHRTTAKAIEVALVWAAWAHAHGRNPEKEMLSRKGGYASWDEKIRKRRDVAELERLFGLSDPTDAPSDESDDTGAEGVIR
jgi:hypothetical protein